MEYCGPRALPHSQFLKWSEDDQDKALAWMLDQQSRCSMCGSYPDEWTTEDDQGQLQRVFPPPWYPRTFRCEGCATVEKEEKLIKSSNDGRLPTGLRVYLSRQPPPKPLEEKAE